MIIRILLNLGYSKDTAQTAYSLLRSNVTTLTNMPGVLTMALPYPQALPAGINQAFRIYPASA